MTATNTTSTPATGITSTSWWLTATTLLGALGVTLYPLITHQSAPTMLAATITSGVTATAVFLGKIWHDIQRRKWAALAEAGAAGAKAAAAAA